MMKNRSNSAFSSRRDLLISMVIFGTIGIFRRAIPLSSAAVAMVRGYMGAIVLFIYTRLKGKKPDRTSIKKNLLLLILSGGFIGINWILLFEAYNYTTVATATLCYYMAPIFVIAASPLLFCEKLTPLRLMCVAAALAGAVLVSGILSPGGLAAGGTKGVLFGLGAAVFYASVICLNKKIHGIAAEDRTLVQLLSAGVVVTPYVLATGGFGSTMPGGKALLLLAVVGIVHTGLAYALYFGSMEGLDAQTIALYSYLDPVVAIVLSQILYNEPMGITGVIGALLILGAALAADLLPAKKE